jgi:hypothetical protein
MEITLDMIEQVIDATKADYSTVKVALEEHDGNVEQAILAVQKKMEEEKDLTEAADIPEDEDYFIPGDPEADTKEYAEDVVKRLKERVKTGGVKRVIISRDGKVLLDVPASVGLVGGLVGFAVLPWAMIVGVIVGAGLNCKIEVIDEDGESEEI